LLANVHERIATFLMEQVIIAGGKFYADETVWAQIMYGD
jgi:formamidopyrimidine-DNA glycosylase